ncbi:hypothetical protein QUF75_18525 [Desulfococcaceae bacterium HSG7]|nr:hypothetical protein [Desulfococcaceae bacterium HSG7]
MKRLQKDSVLISLIEALKTRGSWCGETHIQKTAYFLQELLGVPLDLDFILYKHGPYSFDLSDTLTQMQADFMIKPIPMHPYGASLTLGDTSSLLKKKFPKTIANHKAAVNFVAVKLAGKNVGELERVSTAMYVTREADARTGSQERAERIHQLKPHVSIEQALEAVIEFDRIQKDAGAYDTPL